MIVFIKTHLVYSTAQACDVLLQIEPGSDAGQRCYDSQFSMIDSSAQHAVAGEEGIGTRRWATVGPAFACQFETHVEITRAARPMPGLQATARLGIPGDVIKYMMPSRYCQSELFVDFVAIQFEGLQGGALVQALSDWISGNFRYDNSASHAGTTATDSFGSLCGVCRDYAHVLIALVRAAGIPARYVSVYAPNVVPQDFHAVVEVYLEGAWHLIDPTGMADARDIVRICVGRDAADASFLTSYGWLDLQTQSVDVQRVDAG